MLWRSKPTSLTIRNADEPVCAECKHSVVETRNWDGEYEVDPFRVLVCKHPSVTDTTAYRDIVTGRVVPTARPTCHYTRSPGKCGRQGAWWEAK